MKELITQLKAISFEKPESIVYGLDLIQFHFNHEDYSFSASNKVLMLGEQLQNVNMSMDEKIKLLNSLIFEKEGLYISFEEDAPIFLKHLFDKNIGDINLVSLIYQYLLKKLNVRFQMWSSQKPHLIKVYDTEKTYVLNLNDKGLKAKGKDLSDPPEEQINPIQTLIYNVLTKVADLLLIKNDLKKSMEIYDCILSLFPEKVFWYARRGLLNKNLGFYQEALKDLERYSNFVAEKDFSSSIIQALVELKGLKYISANLQNQTH